MTDLSSSLIMLWTLLAIWIAICIIMAAVTRHLWILFGGLSGVFLAEGLRMWAENGCFAVPIIFWCTSFALLLVGVPLFLKSLKLAKKEDSQNRKRIKREKAMYNHYKKQHAETFEEDEDANYE